MNILHLPRDLYGSIQEYTDINRLLNTTKKLSVPNIIPSIPNIPPIIPLALQAYAEGAADAARRAPMERFPRQLVRGSSESLPKDK